MTTTTTDSDPYPTGTIEHRDVHRRIRNILDQYPASTWNLEESQAVLATLAGIVRARQEVTR